ncbi:DUF2147 domain-containing protein [Sphingobium boeckii]|uniref:Uncharacterized protein (DUF2147 family) n=1 Tax=Sphingobium boeckii TaxID=1082345 RepID=A0A7W9AL63_9SPHN|nr:DUF2147 domain-containing protein [Sphingobium boeckii]MBB5687444.1 uncharacterized protein (DUF2147 family) [Sphingobium boeckii]
MRFTLSLVPAMALLMQVALAAPAIDDDQLTQGVWRNKKNNVHVQAHRCGKSVCGTIIWASDKAKADARAAGTPNLIGRQLFEDFRKDEKGVWHGRVFVPDIGKTFSGTIRAMNNDMIKGTGCLFAGLFCKSQIWTRVK